MGAIVAGVAGGLVLLWAVLSFNRFVAQRHLIDNSWSNVESELKRRHDLIPNLVRTVEGYTSHESTTLNEVTAARTSAVAATGGPDRHAGPENLVTSGLRQLMAVSESYPELVASAQFLELQRELVTTENRLQAARRLFNGNVREFNQRVESVPSMVIARLGRFRRRDYFEVESAVALAPGVGDRL